MNFKKFFISAFLIVASTSAFAGNLAKVNQFSIMSYNLENLFDNKHDKGKSDWTWLPLSFKQQSREAQDYCASMTNDYYRKNCLELDWSNAVINKKIKNLARVITSYNNKRGADIVVFQEIENMNALKMLVKRGLKNKGYKYLSLIEGPDSRGIDVAMISRYPIISQKYHNIDLKPHSERSTRGILQVNFRIAGKKVTVFGNHWPSQGNVDETRVLASEVLKKASKNLNSHVVIATGDFNTLHDDQPHGLNMNILPLYEDVEIKGRQRANVKALGTHWYRGDWESLDKILVLKSSLKNKKARVDYKSFDILYHDFMLKDLEWTDRDTGVIYFDENIPSRYDAKTGEGYSDHLPVAVKIVL